MARKRTVRAGWRVRLLGEVLEARFCLSAVSAALPVVTNTTTVEQDGALYVRLGNPQNAGTLSGLGGIALEGGGTDIAQVFQWLGGRMGGKGDFLVLRSENDSSYNPYIYKFGGFNSVATLDIPDRAAAMNPAVMQIIESADGLFIGGGSQNEYLDWWQGTPVEQAIGADLARGVPIGGTSAGTDVLGQFIQSAEYNSIASTQALQNPFDPNITLDQQFLPTSAFPFLNNTMIDAHFITRDRTGRLLTFLSRVDAAGWSPNDRPQGIGINEQTALLITPNGQAQVVSNPGASNPVVEFFATPGLPQTVLPDQPLTWNSIAVDMVSSGGTFNCSNWADSFQVHNQFSTYSTITVNKGVLIETSAASAADSPASAKPAQDGLAAPASLPFPAQ